MKTTVEWAKQCQLTEPTGHRALAREEHLQRELLGFCL